MKNSVIHKWIKYYRNSLADGEMLDIKTKDCDEGFFYKSIHELNTSDLTELFQALKKTIKRKSQNGDFEKEGDDIFTIDIFLAPFSLQRQLSHAKETDNILKVFPYWIPATINQDGFIKPPENIMIPWFIRSVLEPIVSDSKSFPILSSVEAIDNALMAHVFNYQSWDEYWDSSEFFFKTITGNKYESFSANGFYTNNTICIIKAKEIITAQNILSIYNDLLNIETHPPLITDLLSFKKPKRKQIPNNGFLFLQKGHYGQYNNKYPLSNSQRVSLLLFESEDIGKTLAVNGPPGTGKTTLLQSIVANEIVKAVINGDTPPRIIASSANNQAITNIIDSFGSTNDNLERWLPQLTSLGTYLISSDAKRQNEALKKGYKIMTRNNENLEGYYFTDFHEVDIYELEQYFIKCFENGKSTINNVSVELITETLKKKIEKTVKKIDDILNIIHKVQIAEQEYCPLDQLSNLNLEIEKKQQDLSLLINEKANHLTFRDKFNQFKENNKFSLFFSFIPSIKQSYNRKLSIFLADCHSIYRNLNNNKKIDILLAHTLHSLNEKIENVETDLIQSQKIYNTLIELKINLDNVISELSTLWDAYLRKKNPKEKEQIEIEFQSLDITERANRILDVSYRYETFINAVHYWEGMWIIKQKNEELNINKGLKSKENLLTRISYLTPLFISTFHSAPAFCSYFEKTIDGWIQRPIYNLFDLLIVDEAGQVAPEIGIPSFSLAKKALVVGDIYQIEPVWNIGYEQIDIGNLEEVQLLQENEFSQLKDWGVVCSSGSLMHIAQLASSYEISSQIGGTLLTEHRRCVNELVAFSNKYIYDNLLKPMVGSSIGIFLAEDSEKSFLPTLGYLNIRGYSEKRSGSTFNTIEAVSIAKWIKKYGKYLLDYYNNGKTDSEKIGLKDCIAVITPFSEQKQEIIKQFLDHKIDTDITVGTVHALQGAERPVVIFSPTYGLNTRNAQLFFDSGYNMLNVALTRAKKHFIVMGNMNLFNPHNERKPSGGLAQYLFASPLNELSTAFLFEEKNVKSINRVDSLERHQQCLKRAFQIAKRRIIIVSPFISISAIQSDNLLPEIQKVVANKIEVHIYTDKYLDLSNGKLKQSSKEGREALIDAGAQLFILNGIHNKALVIDDTVLIEGSFNWLSAVRDKKNAYYRHEVSHIIIDKEAAIQISQLEEELKLIAN